MKQIHDLSVKERTPLLKDRVRLKSIGIFAVLALILVLILLIGSELRAQQQYYPGGLNQSSLELWLDADDTNVVVLSNGNVSEWKDKSGNSNNAFQANSSYRPELVENALNGKPVIRFAASHHMETNLHPSGLSGGASVAMVVKTTGSGDRSYFGSWGNPRLYVQNRSGDYQTGFGNNWERSGTHPEDQHIVSGFYSDGSTVRGFVNSNQEFSYSASFSGTNGNSIGIGYTNGVSGRSFSGDMTEIVFYAANVGLSTRNILDNYLAAKWGIELDINSKLFNAPNGYDRELAGIGRENNSDIVTSTTYSSGGLGFSSGTTGSGFLKNDGNYIMAAHNGGDFLFPRDTMNRVWYVDKTENSSGNVTLYFDMNVIKPGEAVYADDYALIYADNPAFNNATVISSSGLLSGNELRFTSNSSNFSDGYYTLKQDRYIWTGNSSAAWETPGNWDKNRTPAPSMNIVIPNVPNQPAISSDVILPRLTVDANAGVTVNSNHSLTVTGALINQGTFTVENNASLIQEGSSDENTGSGTYIIKRDGTSHNLRYNGWSSPVRDMPLLNAFGAESAFDDANPCDVFAFSGALQTWKYDYPDNHNDTCVGNPVTFSSNFTIPGGDGLMDAGRGYFAPGNNTASLRTFSGNAVHNGNITYTLEPGNNPGNVSWTDDNWNLIGNPYPSGINIDSFLTHNAPSLHTAAVYVWADDGSEGANYSPSDYIIVNSIGSTGANGVDITEGSISSCQGFFVQGDGDVTFTNSMRTNANDEFRSGGDNPVERFRLSVFDTSITSEILVGFNAGATRGFDKMYDAPKRIGQQKLNLSAQLPDGDEMVIIGEPPLNYYEERLIPLTVQADAARELTVELNSTELYDDEIGIILIDSLLDKKVNLKKENYTFSADSAGSSHNRFVLLLTRVIGESDEDISSSDQPEAGTDTGAGNEDEQDDIASGIEERERNPEIKVRATRGEIVAEAQNTRINTVMLIDMNGREVMRKRGAGENRVTLETARLSSGIYMVRTLDTDNNPYTDKVFLR